MAFFTPIFFGRAYVNARQTRPAPWERMAKSTRAHGVTGTGAALAMYACGYNKKDFVQNSNALQNSGGGLSMSLVQKNQHTERLMKARLQRARVNVQMRVQEA